MSHLLLGPGQSCTDPLGSDCAVDRA